MFIALALILVIPRRTLADSFRGIGSNIRDQDLSRTSLPTCLFISVIILIRRLTLSFWNQMHVEFALKRGLKPQMKVTQNFCCCHVSEFSGCLGLIY